MAPTLQVLVLWWTFTHTCEQPRGVVAPARQLSFWVSGQRAMPTTAWRERERETKKERKE